MTKTQLGHPKDGLFRYRVGLSTQDGQQLARDIAVRWSPDKVDSIEVGMACRAQESYLSKKELVLLTCERVA